MGASILTNILTSGFGGGGTVQEFSPTATSSNNTDWTFIAILLMVLLIIGGVGYFLMNQGK